MNPLNRRSFHRTLAAGALLGCGVPVRAQEKIVVGATVPITGAFAASGLQYYNSLRMAQDEINAAGGINGRPLAIVFEDTQASNSVAVNAFVKLVQQHKPAFVFLSSLSTQVLAMEPEVLKAKVATIHAGGATAIQERRNPWLFRARPADSLGANAMAFGIHEVLKKRKPGILYAQDDYGTGAANALEALLGQGGVALSGKEAFNPRDNDFSAQLLALKNKGADMLVSFNYNRDGALILKQRKSLGLDMPVMGGTGMVAPSTLELVDAVDLAGVYSTADTLLGEAVRPGQRRVRQALQRALQDAARFVRHRLLRRRDDRRRRAAQGRPDAEKLRAHLGAVKGWPGMARSYSTDPATNNMAHSVVLVSFKPGTKEMLGVATYPKA